MLSGGWDGLSFCQNVLQISGGIMQWFSTGVPWKTSVP